MKKSVLILSAIAIWIFISVSAYANAVATEYTINNNGKQLFSNKEVLVENDMVYLPLEELLDKLEITKNPDNYLHIDNNKFALYIAGGNYNDIYNMEIDKRQIVYTQVPETYAPATRETMYAPVLRNDVIYIPFEYMEYIFNSSFADTGLYNIELKNNTEYHDDVKNDNSILIQYSILIIGSGIVVFILGFVIGYVICKKKYK